MPVETRASTAKKLKAQASRLDHNEIDALIPTGATLLAESPAPYVFFDPVNITTDPATPPSASPLQEIVPDTALSATRPANSPVLSLARHSSLDPVQSQPPEEIMRPSGAPRIPDPYELPSATDTTPARTQPTANFVASTAVSTPQRAPSTNLAPRPSAPAPSTTAHPGMYLTHPQARRQLNFLTDQRTPNNSIPPVASNPTLEILKKLESTVAEISQQVRSTDTNLTHLQDTVLREAHQVRLLMSDAATQFDITNSSIVGIVNALAKLREELSALGSKSDTQDDAPAHDTSFVPTPHPPPDIQPVITSPGSGVSFAPGGGSSPSQMDFSRPPKGNPFDEARNPFDDPQEIRIQYTRNYDLVFPTYSTNRFNWRGYKNVVLRACLDHPLLRMRMIVRSDGSISFPLVLAHDANTTLYMALRKAINTDLWTQHCTIMHDQTADGLGVFRALDEALGDFTTDPSRLEKHRDRWENYQPAVDTKLGTVYVELSERLFAMKECHLIGDDNLRDSAKFLLAFGSSRSNPTLGRKILAKYEKVMNRELREWWVDGLQSTYQRLTSYLQALETIESRIKAAQRGYNLSAWEQTSNDKIVDTTARRNGKNRNGNGGRTNGDNDRDNDPLGDNDREANRVRRQQAAQARDDRLGHLKKCFSTKDIQGIAALYSRHSDRKCYVHGSGCNHHLFQCNLFEALKSEHPDTAAAAMALVEEKPPAFAARRATIPEHTPSNTDQSNSGTRGETTPKSTVNNDDLMYSAPPTRSSILDLIPRDCALAPSNEPSLTPPSSRPQSPCPLVQSPPPSPTSILPPLPGSDPSHPLSSAHSPIDDDSHQSPLHQPLHPAPTGPSPPRLTSSTTPPVALPSAHLSACPDSGTTHHMFGEPTLFSELHFFEDTASPPPLVSLGDDNHHIPATGWGVVDYMEGTHRVRRIALFVPALGPIILLSIKKHTTFTGCAFHATSNTAVMAYPSHITDIENGEEYSLPISPLPPSPPAPSFDETEAALVSTSSLTHDLIQPDLSTYISKSDIQRFSKQVTFAPLTLDAHLPVPSPTSLTTFDIKCPSTTTIPPGFAFTAPLAYKLSTPPTVDPIYESTHHSLRVSFQETLCGPIATITNASDSPISLDPSTTIGTVHFSHNNSLLRRSTTSTPSTTPPPSRGLFRLGDEEFIFYDNSSSRSPRAKRVSIPTAPPVEGPSLPSGPSPATSSRTPPWTHPPSNSPQVVQLTHDRLMRSIGFLGSQKIIKAISLSSKPTINIQDFDRNPTLDSGEVASLRKADRNRNPSPLPAAAGDLYHCDIGFGPTRAIGGAFYSLLLVDKRTRHSFIYPLKNLKTDLVAQFKQFLVDVDGNCRAIRTDFDPKLIQGGVRSFLTEKGIDVTAAPPRQQHKNGLVERKYQTILKMTRNWLTSALLPSSYWWLAMKRAVEVSNTLPTFHIDTPSPTTPHELFYGEQPDLRALVPMFTPAWVTQPSLSKFHTNSLLCICVGRCPTSNGLLFYHPPTKRTFTEADSIKFDFTFPAGPRFNEKYDGSFTFTSRADLDNILHRPSPFNIDETVFVKHPDNDKYTKASIFHSPFDASAQPFTVRFPDGSLSQHMADDILDHDPDAPLIEPSPAQADPLLPWIKHDAKVTFSHPALGPQHKWGFLQHDPSAPTESAWSFVAGKNKTGQTVELPNFRQIIPTLLTSHQLFNGWRTIRTVGIARRMSLLTTAICRKVHASKLDIKSAPASLLRHNRLSPNDRILWDASYAEEYNGLRDLNTWEVITEEEYIRMRPYTGSALPSMAISTLKKDKDGNPVRCKYRIVVLGNLDPHNWSKSDCFAPVLSQLELRTLLAIAASKNCTPKQADVSQAFVQSTLPSDEKYIISPPAGCPLSKPKTYLRLLKTLYGLKRSPRHWYEKARSILISLGLRPCTHSPCIFHGCLIPGHPPIYIGLYVDDLIYFSESNAVEKVFEKRFGSKIKTTFNGPVDHFLGIAFSLSTNPAGNTHIALSQPAFIETLLEEYNYNSPKVNSTPSPFRSGLPVDSIPDHEYSFEKQRAITEEYQHLVGSFQWLASSTRPDLATITNILARYSSNPSVGHLNHCKHVLKYLKGTIDLGISFCADQNQTLSSYIHFPLSTNTLTGLSDANWGPQDQSQPKDPLSPQPSLPLFKSRSMSGYIQWLNGPLHWQSKRQTITARSTAEAEIYATDECCKSILHIRLILSDLELLTTFCPGATTIYNDNNACVLWSTNMTTKGLRHVQIRENAVRESIANNTISVHHIAGDVNIADLFTKEDRDVTHFLSLRNAIMTPCSG